MPSPPRFHRHRSSDSRESKHSIALSPITAFTYSETDPFLSPKLSPSTPYSPYLHPPSSPRTPTTLHSPSQSPLNSPGLSESHGRFFEHVAIPPTAKRARRSTWMLAGGGLLLFVALVCLTSRAVSDEQLSDYSTRVSNGFSMVKEWSVRGSAGEEKVAAAEALVLQSEMEEELPAEIRITTLPQPRLPRKEDPDARYLGFLPHSGYHNQRIALQNALLLGKLLNRTVLLPPVWIDWPVPTQYYSDLRESWLNIMLLNPSSFNLSTLLPTSPLNLANTFESTAAAFPCPTCDADNSTLLAERAALNEAKRAKWAEQGYDVRPDGYPIVPTVDAASCKSYSVECKWTYNDTFLAWDFLVDIERAREVGVEVVDRWDMREKAVEELLGVKAEDVVSSAAPLAFDYLYVVEDRRAYDFRFTDRLTSRTPLITDNTDSSHWHRDISIPTLRSDPHKVLLLGSLFGSGRVSTTRHPESKEWSEAFGRAMAFKNEWLLRPADAIVARLGGQSNFVGVHVRVGDGEFLRHARQNCEGSWRRMVGEEMGVREEVLKEMWEKIKPQPIEEQGKRKRSGDQQGTSEVETSSRKGGKHHHRFRRTSTAHLPPPPQDDLSRSAWSMVDDEYDHNLEAPPPSHTKRGLIDSAFDWISYISSVEPSTRLRNLTCRAPLHTEARFKPFNTPLYLATDSRSPETDVNLRPFFNAFPCTFILSDFDRPDVRRNDGVVVRSVNEMSRLVNDLDGVSLGRLFLPFLEAIVAAKARLTVGTAHSTFSGTHFASSCISQRVLTWCLLLIQPTYLPSIRFR
ncbi:hypothetical protein JCM11251_002040 [Rhodosporidiobolus azoricus]